MCLLILYLIIGNVRTSANLKNYTKYSTDVTFTLQKSISMWYNNKRYSIQVDKNGISNGIIRAMYSFWDIVCDIVKIKSKIKSKWR